MRRPLLFILSISLSLPLTSQTFSSQDPAYVTNVQAGELALRAEKFDSCLIYYEQAFKRGKAYFFTIHIDWLSSKYRVFIMVS